MSVLADAHRRSSHLGGQRRTHLRYMREAQYSLDTLREHRVSSAFLIIHRPHRSLAGRRPPYTNDTDSRVGADAPQRPPWLESMAAIESVVSSLKISSSVRADVSGGYGLQVPAQLARYR